MFSILVFIRILLSLKGSGLGRLPLELASMGYKSQGHEFSFFMLIPTNFILNFSHKKEQFQIFPFIHNFSNNFTVDQPFEGIKIPDVCPADVLPEDRDFSMVAGEFMEVYSQQKGSLNIS